MAEGKMRSVVILFLLCVVSACSEAPPLEHSVSQQKVTLSGTFLTESPDEIKFPVKVLFAVDCSLSMGDDVDGARVGSDPYDLRIEAVRNFIQTYNTEDYPNVSFEIMLWNKEVFLQSRNGENQPGFTRSAEALNQVLDAARNDAMTNYLGTLDAIRADIENDIWTTTQEEGGIEDLVRTKYIVVFLSDGMPNGQGGTQANEEIWQKVEEIYDMAEENRVGSFNFHTFLLLGGFGPTESGQDARQQATVTLQGMAKRGGGKFLEFESAEAIDFIKITDLGLTTEYKIKYLVACNYNVKPGTDRLMVDSDGDGLSDEEEVEQGSHPRLTDPDGDGLSDFFEVKLSSPGRAFNPNVADSPCQAPADGIWIDSDNDDLSDCEEYVKGTQRFVPDTDRDGIPDGIEFRMDTDPLQADSMRDADFDGVQDRLEVQKHSNVTTNDPIIRDRYSYRYELTDGGLVPVIQGENQPSHARQYTFTISNIDILDTLGYSVGNQVYQTPGENWLRLYVAQVPFDMPDSPPVFRMLEIRINTSDASRHITANPYDFQLLQ